MFYKAPIIFITTQLQITYLMFKTDLSHCKILGQEQNGEFILCWNLKGQGRSYTVVGLFFYTIKKIQVSKNYRCNRLLKCINILCSGIAYVHCLNNLN